MADAKKVKILYALGFMDVFAFSMFVPLLFDYLRSLEVSHFTIGLLGSIHSGLQLISSPIIGSWSDIRGHSTILQAMLMVCATFYFLLGTTKIFPLIVLSRIIHGLCEHTQTLCGSLLAEATSPEKLSEVQGRMASIGGIAFMVGPIIGGHLGEYDNGFQCVCFIVSLVLTINLAIVRFLLPNSSKESRKKSKRPVMAKGRNNDKKGKSLSSDIFRVVTDLKNINWPLYWDIFAFKFLVDFTCGLHYQNFRIILMEVYNVTSTWIGYCMAMIGLVGATTGFLNGHISKLYKNDTNHGHKAFHSSIAFALSFILLGSAPNLTFIVISLLLQSASTSLVGITVSEIILSRTAPDQRGSILGTAQSIVSLSFLMTPISSGLMYEFYGNNGIAILKVLTATAALALSLLLLKTKRNKKKSS